MGKVIGVDLGTTNSLIAIRQGSETKVIANLEGSRLTPSVVAFTDEGRLIGRPAKAQAVTNPARTISSIKRCMGRRYSELTAEEKTMPYKIVSGEGGVAQVEIDGRKYYPPEISAMILQDLKKSAEEYLGEQVTGMVITVPAWFDDGAREATRTAGKIAGIDVKRIINEPTAAALAYGLGDTKDQKILVADLGGGTLDYSILHVGDGVFEVLSTSGDVHLGGDNFDRAIVEYVANEFQSSTGFDIRKDPMALQRLTEASEKAKCDLSNLVNTTINLPYICVIEGVARHLTQTLTRAKFEELCNHLFERTRVPALKALSDAKLTPQEVNEVVLVGGSSRMPRFQEICKEIFGRLPQKNINPDEAVAAGAAIQAAILSADDPSLKAIVLLDVTPLSLGVELQGGIFNCLIPRNTGIPVTKSETYTTAGDSQPAVEIHVLQGERKMAQDNRTLGKFILTGIPPAPRGVPQIEVSFALDANGLLNVTARDKNTMREQKVEIRGSSGLERDQITRMVAEAASHAEEDKQKVALIEAQNTCNQKAYATDKAFKEHSGKLTKPTFELVQQAILSCRNAAEGQSKELCDKAVYNIGIADQKMAEELSAANKAAAAQEQGPTIPLQPKPPAPPVIPPQQTPMIPPQPQPGTRAPTEVNTGFTPMG